ncbi:MAG: hypothetical protein OEW18_09870, partial [Candidatus Aminicenantes bacterium]|nr:hypothetical protein [Candidatus Aminicenantes bacterium]
SSLILPHLQGDCKCGQPPAVCVFLTAEYPVLPGLKSVLASGSVRRVCCEIHAASAPHDGGRKIIVEFLTAFGFRSLREFRRGGEIHAVFPGEKGGYQVTGCLQPRPILYSVSTVKNL